MWHLHSQLFGIVVCTCEVTGVRLFREEFVKAMSPQRAKFGLLLCASLGPVLGSKWLTQPGQPL